MPSNPRPRRPFRLLPRSLMPDCEEVHHMTMKSMDRPLGWFDRLRMRAHLGICDACTNFLAQMRLIRSAMHQLGHEDEDEDGRR